MAVLQHDVLGLDVAMDDAKAVRVFEDTTSSSSSVNADVTISISPWSARANSARTGSRKRGCSSMR